MLYNPPKRLPADPVAWARIRDVHPINHLLHLALTVLTAGAWSPVWALWSVRKHDLRVRLYWSGGVA